MNPFLRQALVRTTAWAVFALLLIPVLTWGLAWHFRSSTDAGLGEAIAHYVKEVERQGEDVADIRTWMAQYAPSSSCAGVVAAVETSGGGLCDAGSPLWQFYWMERAAAVTAFAGLGLLALMAGLGRLAFARRAWQLRSFVVGRRLLVPASALMLTLQGVFATWLSFWITAFFFDIWVPKLILIVAAVVAMAVFAAVKAILGRARLDDRVHGEHLDPAAAPALWARLREFAQRLGTAPPDEVVAGIDANFFVTEQPLRAGERQTRGRSLFVSLPLLRVLAQDEADAVLAHELGHFAGGDTVASAALGPELVQFDHYLEQMRVGGLTVLAFHVLHLYRLIFELALSRSSREREFAADRAAAGLVSADALARALVKVSAYALYRGQVESELFGQDSRHSSQLDIGRRVAEGLADFSRTPAFVDGVRGGGVPHPFDSHPPLRERIAALGAELPDERFVDVVCAPPAATWIESIDAAGEVEARLWQQFEQHFTQAHEESLAWRYLPANEEERAIVEKYFPAVRFDSTADGRLEIDYAGLRVPGREAPLPFDAFAAVTYEDNSIRDDQLSITHPAGGWDGRKSLQLAIPLSSRDRQRFKEVLGRYWQRHQVMRAQQQAS